MSLSATAGTMGAQMAYHYREPGFTPIEVGVFYARSLHYYSSKVKLKRYNPTTGSCVIAYDSGSVVYLSDTDLSHWHRIGEGDQL